LPAASLYAAAAVAPKLREIWVTNTTATAVDLKIVRVTTTGTQGAAQTAAKDDPDTVAASASPRTTHTVGPTLSDEIGRISVGAAIGAGAITPFGDMGVRIPVGTGNGIAIVPTGTGQALDVTFVWDE